MATRICPDVLNDCNPCAGDQPWANLSAELAEPYVFVSPHIIIRNPPLGQMFSQLGCKRWCYSAISQADADACAIAQATECATIPVPQPPIIPNPPDPPVGFPTVSVGATTFSTSFGEAPGVFQIYRTGSLAQPLAVQFTLSGTAQNGVDYDTVPYAVTIDAGDSDVEVIIVPMDTGEIISKRAILTILGGSNYSPGAFSSDRIDIAPDDCGTPAFKVFGYGPELAAIIAALRPNALPSELPEWDGIFRQPPGQSFYLSNAGCYSIAGKSIEVALYRDRQMIETIGCSGYWQEALPGNPGCFACLDGFEQGTYITSDFISITDDAPAESLESNDFRSQTTGVIGDYKYTYQPNCADSFIGYRTYHLDGAVARVTYGEVLLTVVAL